MPSIERIITGTFTERIVFPGGKVDRTGTYPVVKDVLLSGLVSDNGREYPAECYGPAGTKLYEGRLLCVNHGIRPGAPRKYEDKLGWVENERRDGQGRPIGDVGVNPKHPLAEQFLWDAEHRPNDCGMSHVVNCQYRDMPGGRKRIVKILEVDSVDVVIGPATTRGLFEQSRGGRNVPKIKLKEYAEQFARNPHATLTQILKVKRLAEMDMGTAEVEVEPMADDAASADAMTDAFVEAAMAEIRECMGAAGDKARVSECLKKLKKILNAHADINEMDAPSETAPPTEGATDTAEEQRKRAELPYTVLAECEKAGYRAGPQELRFLTSQQPAERAAYIAEQKSKRPGEKPSAPQRNPGSGTAGPKPVTATATVQEQRKFPKFDA